MQKIVLFIEPPLNQYYTPLKIGNLFMNRFAIDEDGSHEIMKIKYLENRLNDYCFGELTEDQGTDCIIALIANFSHFINKDIQ